MPKPEWLSERMIASAAALGATALAALLLDVLGQLLAGNLAAQTVGPLVLASAFLLHLIGALIIGSLTWLIARARALPPTLGAWRVAVAALIASLPFSIWLGQSLASGAWVSTWRFAPVVAIGVPGAIGGAALALAWVLGRWGERRAIRWALVAVAVLLACLNATILPGLYAEAHVALYAATLTMLALGVFPLLLERAAKIPPYHAQIGAVLSLVLGLVGVASIGEQRLRLVRLSPGISALLSVALPPLKTDHLHRELARTEPLAPFRADPARSKLGPKPTNVLWVVVDTLRADALPPVRDGDEGYVKDGDTPFFNRWLKDCYRFESAYSQASQTKLSMPPMFSSLEPFQDPARDGQALGQYAHSLGLKPVALVPQYFLMPAQARSQALLDGFETFEIFEKDKQQTMIPQAKRLFGSLGSTPFLAWVHFYNMHDPYFADGLQKGVKPKQGYRSALRWLDKTFEQLMGVLQETKQAERTLVILSADHGELLGEGKAVGHGSGLRDEEVHVPLAICLPGAKGGEVAALVGNIDVLPTVIDLLGHPADPRHAGTTLTALMKAQADTSNRARYFISGNEKLHGVVTQDEKLLYSIPLRGFSLFARPSADSQDLYGLHPDLDEALVAELVQKNPELFKDELEEPDVRQTLIEALGRVKVDAPSARLDFLLRTARLSEDQAVAQAADAIFERARALRVKLQLSRYLAETAPKLWQQRWKGELAKLQKKPGEVELVRALANQRFAARAEGQEAKRLDQLARSTNADERQLLTLWLSLLDHWGKSAKSFGPPLHHILTTISVADADVAVAALNNVADLRRIPRTLRRRLERSVLPFTHEKSSRVVVSACRALSSTGSKKATQRLRQLLRNDDPKIRQAALHALARLDKARATADLVRIGKDPLLTADAIQALARVGSTKALPFLKGIARTHYNSWTRNQAKGAIRKIKERGKAAKKR